MANTSLTNVILVADDDADDLFLIRRLLTKAGVKNPVMDFRNGDELVSFLRPVAAAAEKNGRPCVLFLDIKMPKVDGFEVLRWIRKQSAFANLPVVMLSGSDEPRDIKKATELGATRYLIKHPPVEVVSRLVAEWTGKQ